jgi:hypothetical protein
MQETVIFKNEDRVSLEEVVKLFSKTLEDSDTFKKSEIEELTDIVSKSCIDKFIVYTKPEVVSMQGDLLIWADSTSGYKREFPRVSELTRTDSMALQEGDSMTGDHCLVPLKNAKFTLKTGKFIPSILEGHLWGNNSYSCKVLDIDTPFVIRHREHGNITLPSGKYMICSSLDSQTLSRMRD